MNKNNFNLCLFLVAAFLVSSCGTVQKVTYIEPTKADIVVNEHIRTKNYCGLLDDSYSYPNKRETIIQYLSEKNENKELNNLTYHEILSCLTNAQTHSDTLLYSIFNDSKLIYQESILLKIQEWSLEQVINYYKRNPEERDFLRPVLKRAIDDGITDLDYYVLRYYHEMLKDTDLVESIDAKWISKREEVWEIEEAALNEYFSTEIGLYNEFSKEAFNKVCQEVENNMPTIIELCIKEIDKGVADLLFFKINLNDKSLGERVQDIVNEKLSSSLLNSIILSAEDNNKHAILNNRERLAKQILMKDEISIPEFKAVSNVYYHKFTVPKNSLILIEELKAKVRKKQNAVSLASTAISFIPGVGWGYKAADLALGGTDIIFSIFSSKKEAEEVSSLLSTFAEDLYVSIIEQISEQSDAIFNSYKSVLKSGQIMYKDAIHEQL